MVVLSPTGMVCVWSEGHALTSGGVVSSTTPTQIKQNIHFKRIITIIMFCYLELIILSLKEFNLFDFKVNCFVLRTPKIGNSCVSADEDIQNYYKQKYNCSSSFNFLQANACVSDISRCLCKVQSLLRSN